MAIHLLESESDDKIPSIFESFRKTVAPAR